MSRLQTSQWSLSRSGAGGATRAGPLPLPPATRDGIEGYEPIAKFTMERLHFYIWQHCQCFLPPTFLECRAGGGT